MTRLDEESLPPPGRVGERGIPNGLYAVQIRTLDGIDGGLTGVMLLQAAEGRWKGEIVNQEHTKANDAVFGGYEVGIGISGSCDDNGATWEATALTGKRSLRLSAEIRLLHRI